MDENFVVMWLPPIAGVAKTTRQPRRHLGAIERVSCVFIVDVWLLLGSAVRLVKKW